MFDSTIVPGILFLSLVVTDDPKTGVVDLLTPTKLDGTPFLSS